MAINYAQGQDWFDQQDQGSPQGAAAPAMSDAHRQVLHEQLRQAYWYYLGRLPSDQEYQDYADGPNTTDASAKEQLDNIQNSDEAKLYALKHGGNANNTPPPDQDTGPVASAPASTSSGGGSGDADGFGQAWLASGGRTVDDLKKFVAAHPEYGATVGGSKGDKVTIGGRTYDGVLSAGNGGGQGASWNDITNGSSESGVDASSTYTQQFQGPEWTGGDFVDTPWTGGEFQAPQLNDTTDPGYSARLAEGQQALQRSAAAKGTLLTPQALKALETFSQDYASGEYGNVYNRAQGEYQQQYGQYLQNRQNNLQDYQQQYGQYTDQFNRALQTAGFNQGANAQNFSQALAQNSNNYTQLYQLAALSSQNQNALNSTNLGYAQLYGSNAFGNTNAYNSAMNDASNAYGAGAQGSSSAYGNALNSGLNSAFQAYLSSYGRQRPSYYPGPSQ